MSANALGQCKFHGSPYHGGDIVDLGFHVIQIAFKSVHRFVEFFNLLKCSLCFLEEAIHLLFELLELLLVCPHVGTMLEMYLEEGVSQRRQSLLDGGFPLLCFIKLFGTSLDTCVVRYFSGAS